LQRNWIKVLMKYSKAFQRQLRLLTVKSSLNKTMRSLRKKLLNTGVDANQWF